MVTNSDYYNNLLNAALKNAYQNSKKPNKKNVVTNEDALAKTVSELISVSKAEPQKDVGGDSVVDIESIEVPTYPEIKGETVKQEGVGEEEKQTEADILAGKDTNATLPVILPEYEELTYDAMTDEEIGAYVRQALEAYKRAAIADIDNEKAATVNKSNSLKNTYATQRTESIKTANDIYDEARERIDADMLKRGLARSSTAVLLGADAETARANALAGYESSYQTAIAELDAQIAEAESKRQKAIDDFNIEYAVKYAQQVEELQKERAEKQEEVIKYNNSLKSQQYDEKLAGLKVQASLKSAEKAETEAEEGKNEKEDKTSNTGTSTENSKKLYELYRAQLAGMSEEEAKQAVRTDSLYADTLTTELYLALIEEFGR